jgi:hypothetical protein
MMALIPGMGILAGSLGDRSTPGHFLFPGSTRVLYSAQDAQSTAREPHLREPPSRAELIGGGLDSQGTTRTVPAPSAARSCRSTASWASEPRSCRPPRSCPTSTDHRTSEPRSGDPGGLSRGLEQQPRLPGALTPGWLVHRCTCSVAGCRCGPRTGFRRPRRHASSATDRATAGGSMV